MITLDVRIDPSPQEKQEIYESLIERNQVRIDAQLPKLNIPELYREQLEELRYENYIKFLKPLVEAAKKALTRSATQYVSQPKLNDMAFRIAQKRALSLYGIEPVFSNSVKIKYAEKKDTL